MGEEEEEEEEDEYEEEKKGEIKPRYGFLYGFL